jgi:hypothetical protein
MTERTRWFFDTEFNEDGHTIDLISIALVCEDGREYYAVSKEFDPSRCNDWVRANVLPLLPSRDFGAWKTRSEIATDIRELVIEGGAKPEFHAYFADYDWVVLCQLYGRMVDLPKGFPFYCRDLKQRMDDLGVKKDQLPAQEGAEHSALDDARWVRAASLWLDAQTKVTP